ncbi:hypothetical protein MnTg02_01556 [bacterium MnTg02]|nr:hypothetical protein MnTg02_01556 [bacterium MnTg02]
MWLNLHMDQSRRFGTKSFLSASPPKLAVKVDVSLLPSCAITGLSPLVDSNRNVAHHDASGGAVHSIWSRHRRMCQTVTG